MTKDEKYMSLAIKMAEHAITLDEVPVGCVIVKDDKVVAKACNTRESKKLTIAHAEINAITKANKKLDAWRLEGCEVYITLEPCMMCVGALIHSRVKRIIFGADDYKGGALGSSINALDAKNINHYPEITKGVLKEQCSKLLSDYFRNKR